MFRLCIAIIAVFRLYGAEDWLAKARQQKAAGDSPAALASYEQARQQGEANYGADSVQTARILLEAADANTAAGRTSHALQLATRALSLFKKHYGPEHSMVAEALAAIGSAHTAATEYAAAEPFLERAIAIREKTGNTGDPAFARILNLLAYNLNSLGDYANAKLSQERAIAIFEKAGDESDSGLGQALRGLAGILSNLGDFSGGRAANERALALLEKRSGGESSAAGDLLVTMGNAAKDESDYARARDLYLRAAQIYEKRLGPRNTRVAGALDNLGQALLQLGQYEAAKDTFNRAIEIQKEALGPRSPWVGNLIQGLAKVAAAEGDYARSLELYEENLDIWREQLGKTHPFTVVSLTNAADVLAHLGQHKQAIDVALEAARIRREHVMLTVRTVEERQALHYASLKMTSLDTALTLALSGTPPDRSAAWDALIRTRALVLDEMSARHRAVRSSNDPEMNSLAAGLAAARAELARLAVQGKGRASQSEYDAQLEAQRARMQQAEQVLAVRGVRYRSDIAREHTGFAQVRYALPPNSAIIAYSRFQRKDFTRTGDHASPAYAAFLLRSGDANPRMIALGAAARIEQAVRAWREEIDRERNSRGRSAARNEAAYRAAARTLRQLIWDPAAASLRGIQRVYIVPDGALQFVNLAALPAGAGYLVESGPLLHVLSAERDLFAPPAEHASRKMLAVGDPAFRARDASDRTPVSQARPRGTHAGCNGFSSIQFEPLPGSAAEVRAVMSIWQQHGWTAEALTGEDATEAAVKQAAAGNRVLHIATHGFFLGACPGEAVVTENPLLRSGLALAGANARNNARPDQEDGILTAEEAASLDLEGTGWVVLSGCDTGLGENQAGEGVLGLRRAFQVAGARTVITSLWPVEDEEVRHWMTHLYRNRFSRGAATAAAVRNANVSVLQSRRARKQSTHPFHWASFVAVGDWR